MGHLGKMNARGFLFAAIVGLFIPCICFAENPPLDSTDLDALRAAAGTDVSVRGPVTQIGTTQEGGITFINIGMPKKKGFVAVVFKSNYGAFPDGFSHLANKVVTVTGNLELYKSEQPQIVIRSADQIKVEE